MERLGKSLSYSSKNKMKIVHIFGFQGSEKGNKKEMSHNSI